MKMLEIASRHSRQKINSIEISRRQTVTQDDATNSPFPVFLQQILELAFSGGHQLAKILGPGQLATTDHTSFPMGEILTEKLC